jgi:antitoxin component of MazEF toxin-antitoxin module
MKLQKQLSRRIGNISYPKYVVVLPPKKVREIGWKEGIKLSASVRNKKLIISEGV